MQAVEEAHQVIGAAEGGGRRDLEAHALGQPGVGGALAGGLDGAVVRVEAGDRRGGIGAGQQQRRRPVAAADVSDPRPGGELGLHAVQGRDPRAGEVVQVPRPEEPLAAMQDMLIMLPPREPVAAAEPLGDLVRGVHRAQRDLERADHARGACLIGERHRMLIWQREPPAAVVGQVPARRLSAQPFADVTLRGARARGQLRRRDCSGPGHGPVQAELVAKDDHGAAEQRPDIGDGLADELHHLNLIHLNPPPASLAMTSLGTATGTPELNTSNVTCASATLSQTQQRRHPAGKPLGQDATDSGACQHPYLYGI